MSLKDDIEAVMYGKQPEKLIKLESPPRPDLQTFADRLDAAIVGGQRAKPILDFAHTIEYALHLEGVIKAQAAEIAALKGA